MCPQLDAELKGESWAPSLPPADWNSPSSTTSPSSRPSSAQGLRKARGSGRPAQGSALRQQSSSPASFTNTPPPTSGASAGSSSPLVDDQKARNESYFASLGAANAVRPAELPPSQGGRYTGFGNTPSPPSNSSSHPSFGLSSRNAPGLADFQDDPGAALSKGWSLFSSVLAGATKTVHESVIQPGLERVRDPNFQASVRGYVDEAGRRVGVVGSQANQWGKSQFGVDVVDSVGGAYDNVRDRVAGGPTAPEGYGRLDTYHDTQDWERYDDREGDFFDEFNMNENADHAGAGSSTSTAGYGSTSAANKTAATSNSASGAGSGSTTTPSTAKAGDWDEWKDF